MRCSILALATALLAGCASAPAGSHPNAVPTVAQLLDEPAARAALRALADSAGVTGQTTLTVVLRPDSVPAVHELHGALDDSVAAALARRLVPLVTLRPRTVQRLLLDVELADAPTLATRPLVTRRPELKNVDLLRSLLSDLAGKVPAGTRGTLWLFVDTTGAVTKVQVSRSSGQAGWDAGIAEIALAARYTPASTDGQLVPVWVEQEFMVPARRAGGGRTVERSR